MPDLANVHFNRALVYADARQYMLANFDLLKELELYPASFRAKHYNLAISYFLAKQYDKRKAPRRGRH